MRHNLMRKLTTQAKKSSKKSPSKAKKTPESLFYDALDRLKRIESQNNKVQENLTALITRVTPQIEPYELKKYHAITMLTLKLIPFLSKKTLPEYMRRVLHEWILDNMQALSYNPFHEKIDTTVIDILLQENIQKLQQNESEKFLKRLAKQGHSAEELAEAEELVNALNNSDSLDEFLKQTAKEFQDSDIDEDDMFDFDDDSLFGDESIDNDLHDEDFDTHDYDNDWPEDNQAAQDAELAHLIKGTSINKLFRKIARAMHPDLEQDENKKREKHDQMARLLEAREQKDVAYILQLYTQIFGQLPGNFPQTDFAKLTKIINIKIEHAKQQKDDIIHSNPFHSAFHEWFSAPTKQKEALNIKDFIRESEEECYAYMELMHKITSIASLRNYLEMRIARNSYDFDDDYF